MDRITRIIPIWQEATRYTEKEFLKLFPDVYGYKYKEGRVFAQVGYYNPARDKGTY